LDKKLEEFHSIPPNDVTLLEPAQYKVIDSINKLTDAAGTPLQKLEFQLHPWVSYLIMPLFALANAGIVLQSDVMRNAFSSKVTLGVLFGLVVGKLIGVLLFSWLLVKFKISSLPRQMSWRHMVGVGLLAGVGFTMSLFVTALAFDNHQHISDAKVGIFMASLISGIAGYFVLKGARATPELLEP
jgi:NhaA family Na+:H+ antiporter